MAPGAGLKRQAIFVQDVRDPVGVPGSLRYDTLMTDSRKSAALAASLFDQKAGVQGQGVVREEE